LVTRPSSRRKTTDERHSRPRPRSRALSTYLSASSISSALPTSIRFNNTCNLYHTLTRSIALSFYPTIQLSIHRRVSLFNSLVPHPNTRAWHCAFYTSPSIYQYAALNSSYSSSYSWRPLSTPKKPHRRADINSLEVPHTACSSSSGIEREE